MPLLQQLISNEHVTTEARAFAGPDILQRQSINSLLGQSNLISRTHTVKSSNEEPMSMDDFLCFGSCNDNFNGADLITSLQQQYIPLTPSSTQSSISPGNKIQGSNADVFQFDCVGHSKMAFQRNISFDCSPASPSSPTSMYNRSFHNSPHIRDCSSPRNLENVPPTNGVCSSRSNSPETESENSNQSSNEHNNIIDLMNLLSLNQQSSNHNNNQIHQTFSGQAQHHQQTQHNSFASLLQQTTNYGISSDIAKALKVLQGQSQVLNQSNLHLPIVGFNQLMQTSNQIQNSHMRTWTPPHQNGSRDAHLDRAARFHRSSAAHNEAKFTWNGVLPTRSHRIITYSPKIFLGGIPWDISEQSLIQIFKQFGQIRVEWPGKEQNAPQPKGYAYVIFESEKQVKALLSACTPREPGGNYNYKISSKRIKAKEVEVIPWITTDSNYAKYPSQKLDPTKTVFVGALHGKLTAEGLAHVMNDLFDGVIYAGIDTDKYKYPIGSGRVTFNNNRSYMKAVSAAFVEIKSKFTKKVQIDPYLDDCLCSICSVHQGAYFCRELSCFRYFCYSCWSWQHSSEQLKDHKPLTRNSKSQPLFGIGPQSNTAQNVMSSNSGEAISQATNHLSLIGSNSNNNYVA